MGAARKLFVATFGCRTNQADSSAIQESFLVSGYCLVDHSQEADVIVINSCTVTHRSDQQVRQLARRLQRENPRARLLLTGCYAQRDPERLAHLKGIDAVVGNTRKGELVQIAEEIAGEAADSFPLKSRAKVYVDDFRRERSLDLIPAGPLGGRTRPFVKIQDGCDAKCSYCIIPGVRGPSRSVPPQQILAHIRNLVAVGFREVVLTGIHIGTYGLHFSPRYPLDRLLEEIITIPGLRWVRVSSVEPMELSRRVIRLAAESEKIAPHFHICLQSGCDRTLKRMLRPYNSRKFARIVEEIRKRLPDAGIGTDIIAGFPGETDQDHRESLEFVRQMPFTYLHVFPYSDRTGTAASGMESKVDLLRIGERSCEFRELARLKSREFRRHFHGRRLQALSLDEVRDGWRSALTGNYLKARIPPSIPGNRIIEGRVAGEEGECLVLEEVSEVA